MGNKVYQLFWQSIKKFKLNCTVGMKEQVLCSRSLKSSPSFPVRFSSCRGGAWYEQQRIQHRVQTDQD